MTKELLKHVADNNAELIPEPYDALYQAMGFDAFTLYFDMLGSSYVYVPSMRNVLSECIMAEALKEYARGTKSPEAIAKKYGYTARWMRRELKGK